MQTMSKKVFSDAVCKLVKSRFPNRKGGICLDKMDEEHRLYCEGKVTLLEASDSISLDSDYWNSEGVFSFASKEKQCN